MIKVQALYTFPVKSCAGIKMDKAQISSTGFHLDRNWVVATHKQENQYKFLTQRQKPRMVLIAPQIEYFNENLTEGVLTLTVPGGNQFQLQFPSKSCTEAIVDVWGNYIAAKDEGDKASQFLTEFLGIEVRLFSKDSQAKRFTERVQYPFEHPLKQPPFTAFADQFPFLVITIPSLEVVQQKNSELPELSELNFRGNIVLSGDFAPFEEDGWSVIQIGEVKIWLVKKCSRCTIPNVNPKTGEPRLEPLRSLMSFRRVDPVQKYQAFFGMQAATIKEHFGSFIKEGDKVTVIDQ